MVLGVVLAALVLAAAASRLPAHLGAASWIQLAATAGLLGILVARLVLRGWSGAEAVAAAAVTVLNPVVLYAALQAPDLLLLGSASFTLVMSVARAETVADARSLVMLGLSLAWAMIAGPTGLLLGLCALMLLPLAWRDMKDLRAAVALFIITAFPSLVLGVWALAALPDLRAGLLALPAALAASSAEARTNSPEAGTFFHPFSHYLLLTLAVAPAWCLVAYRLLRLTAARSRPATTLIALLGPALAGGAGSLIFLPDARWSVATVSIAALLGWSATVPLRPGERLVWLVAFAAGTVAAWFAPWLWTDLEAAGWRRSLFG